MSLNVDLNNLSINGDLKRNDISYLNIFSEYSSKDHNHDDLYSLSQHKHEFKDLDAGFIGYLYTIPTRYGNPSGSGTSATTTSRKTTYTLYLYAINSPGPKVKTGSVTVKVSLWVNTSSSYEKNITISFSHGSVSYDQPNFIGKLGTNVYDNLDVYNYGDSIKIYYEAQGTPRLSPNRSTIEFMSSTEFTGYKATSYNIYTNDISPLVHCLSDYAYPIGTVYTTTSSSNPAESIGFGSWAKIKDDGNNHYWKRTG